MNDDSKIKPTTWLIIFAIGIFVIFIWPHEYTWDGEGEIDVFPYTDSVKNYRLPATITVDEKKNGWFTESITYSDIIGQWPNGGEITLADCAIKKDDSSICTDQDGEEYRVEVIDAPDKPESDYSPDY